MALAKYWTELEQSALCSGYRKLTEHKVYINMIMHLLNKHPKAHAIHEIF